MYIDWAYYMLLVVLVVEHAQIIHSRSLRLITYFSWLMTLRFLTAV